MIPRALKKSAATPKLPDHPTTKKDLLFKHNTTLYRRAIAGFPAIFSFPASRLDGDNMDSGVFSHFFSVSYLPTRPAEIITPRVSDNSQTEQLKSLILFRKRALKQRSEGKLIACFLSFAQSYPVQIGH